MDYKVTAPPAVLERRADLITQAVHLVGNVEVDGRQVWDKENIPRYLVTVGCPVEYEPPLLLEAVEDPKLRSRIDEAAQAGRFDNYAGVVLAPTQYAGREVAQEIAAITSSEFLRRNRTVLWCSAEEVFAHSPRRFDSTEEATEIMDRFWDMCSVYELLVVHSVQLVGHSEWEERTLIKVLNERMGRSLPTVLLVSAGVGAGDLSQTPLAQLFAYGYIIVEEM